ncbi:MAG: hypothetical protein AAGA09_01895 [Pseudomonadota bacterium]
MTSFHFNDGTQQLFGVYHAAEPAEKRPPAVLLCNPFGEEALRAHRIFRILAERLARAGAHVLRFDYYGAGDSLGACGELRLSGMAQNIRAAHLELLEMSGASRAVWVGLRLGAAAAVLASEERVRGLAGLYLWEPVINGPAFLAEAGALHIRHIASVFDQPVETVLRRLGPPPAAPSESVGFEISDDMHADLNALDLTCIDQRPARSVKAITEERTEEMAGLAAHLEALGAQVDWRLDEEQVSWNSDKAMNEFIMPNKSVNAIVAAIGDWR